MLNSDEESKRQQKAEKRAVVEAFNKIKEDSKAGIKPKAEDVIDLAEKAKKLSKVVSRQIP